MVRDEQITNSRREIYVHRLQRVPTRIWNRLVKRPENGENDDYYKGQRKLKKRCRG